MSDKDLSIDREKQKVSRREEMFLLAGKSEEFLRADYVLKQLGIGDRTLNVLSDSGEFEMGAVAGVKIIRTESFFAYLDRHHYRKAESGDPIAIDPKGKILKGLTNVGEPHTDIPKLYHINKFAEDLGVNPRTFMRHCEIGTFPHYRIGVLYKMSIEDYEQGLRNASEFSFKRRPGRPDETIERLVEEYKKQKED